MLVGQHIDLGMGRRFAQHVDICIYSIWCNTTASFIPRALAHWLFCNWVFFLRNCIISTVFSTSHFPCDHHNHYHSHYSFLNQ